MQLTFDCHHRYPQGFELEASFHLREPVAALYGPSGSGKSTVLALLAGILRPQQGRVQLGDRVLVDTGRKVFVPPEQRAIGVVFQDQRLFPHLTVEQNLRYGQRRRQAACDDFSDIVETLDLAALLGRGPQNLSGGERQRVALGRALLADPQLLLLDEPWTGLDDLLRDRAIDYLQKVIARWNIPILLVSHSQTEVRRLAREVVVLKEGRVVAAGPTEESFPGLAAPPGLAPRDVEPRGLD